MGLICIQHENNALLNKNITAVNIEFWTSLIYFKRTFLFLRTIDTQIYNELDVFTTFDNFKPFQ